MMAYNYIANFGAYKLRMGDEEVSNNFIYKI